jgi:hypothetical protein
MQWAETATNRLAATTVVTLPTFEYENDTSEAMPLE